MRFVPAVAPLHSRTGKYGGTKSEAHALQEWKQVRGSGSTARRRRNRTVSVLAARPMTEDSAELRVVRDAMTTRGSP